MFVAYAGVNIKVEVIAMQAASSDFLKLAFACTCKAVEEYSFETYFCIHSLSSKQDWVLLCTIEVWLILGFHVLFNCHQESFNLKKSSGAPWWFVERSRWVAGSRWVFMVFHDYRLVLMLLAWFFMVPCRFSWFQVGFSWFQVGFHGVSWFQVGFLFFTLRTS